MSITIIFPPSAITTEQYDEIIRRLEEAGAGSPSGRMFHTCFGTSGHLSVVDVWESAEQFEAFGQTLILIMKEVGAPEMNPQISDTYNLIS